MTIINLNVLRIRSVFVAAGAIAAVGAVVKLAGYETVGAAEARPTPTAGLPMGDLVGRDARVQIIGTVDGTRFDVHSLGGGIVAAGLTADEVAALLPGQDPRNATAQEPTACGPLMLAEPDRRGIE